MALPYYIDRKRPNLSASEFASLVESGLLQPLYDYRMVGTGDASEWVLNETPYSYIKSVDNDWVSFYSPTGEYQGDDLQNTHRGDFKEFFRELATGIGIIGGIGFAVGGVSAQGVIGKAIVGESFAASYPGITQAIGSAAVNTAANGGNIEGTVVSLAASYAGAVTGGYSRILTNSQLVEHVTRNVVTAAFQGNDLANAAKSALINYGLQSMDDLIFYDGGGVVFDDKIPSPMPAISPFDPQWGGIDQSANPPNMFEIPLDQYPVDYFDNILFNTDNVLDQTGGGGGEDYYNTDPYTLPGYDYAIPQLDPVPIPDVVINPQPVNTSGGFFTGITAAMNAALQLVNAYKQVRNPVLNNPTTVTTGGVRRVNSNGTITVTAPNGKVTTSLPQVGVAQTTTDGGLIVNNGDGTYTYIDQAGQRYVRSYQTTPAGGGTNVSLLGGNNTMLIAGGVGVIALLMLSKKRRA